MPFVLRVFVAAGATFVACALGGYAQSSGFGLVGIWQNTLDISQPLRGTLVVTQHGANWEATLAGHPSSFSVRNGRVRFAFRDDAGEFRGRRTADGHIAGFWIQPAAESGAIRNPTGTAQPFASPLVLAPSGIGRWSAVVAPLEPRYTLFLDIFQRDDGSLAAAFRNPQGNSNGGATQFRVARQGQQVVFSAGESGTANEIRIVANVLSSPERLRIFWKDLNTRIDFVRATNTQATAFYPRPPNDPLYDYRQPPTLADGWTTGRASDLGVDEASLNGVIENVTRKDPAGTRPWLVQSLLIAYQGRLILEAYFYGFTRDEPHDLRSAGKTFASVMLGAVMLRGGNLTPESRIYDIMAARGPFANPDPRKTNVTLAELMTHTSGLACDDNADNSPGSEDRMQSQSVQPDWWKYTLDLPMANAPGTRYAYCSAGMNLVGAALTTSTHTWLPELFDATVAKPLRFGRYYWNLMPNGDGYLGGGAYVLPRDFLKIGQTYLNGGIWNGRRIVAKAWIAQSTMPRVPIDETTTGLSAQLFSQFYIASPGDGYAWHTSELKYHDRVFQTYAATGNGGQLLVVVPDAQLAVVITAGNYGQGGIWTKFPQEIVGDGILPAILCIRESRC